MSSRAGCLTPRRQQGEAVANGTLDWCEGLTLFLKDPGSRAGFCVALFDKSTSVLLQTFSPIKNLHFRYGLMVERL